MTMNMPPTYHSMNYLNQNQPQSTRLNGQYTFAKRNPIQNSNISYLPQQQRLHNPNIIHHPSPNHVSSSYQQRPSIPIQSAQYPIFNPRNNIRNVQHNHPVPNYQSNYIPVNYQYNPKQYVQYAQYPQKYSSQQFIPVPHNYYPQVHHQYNQNLISYPIPTTFMSMPQQPFSSQQSLNKNFDYQSANFDVNYQIQQNYVHCVLCDQKYKTSQKSQHLLKHRKKLQQINIRPIDEQQLKRLQKYNKMNKKGLIIKPIVQPEQFNIQYKSNQYVLKKINNYIDTNEPLRNEISIQVNGNQNILPSQLGYNLSNIINNSPRSIKPLNQPSTIAQNPRHTNYTRFGDDSLRIQEQIGYQSKFRNTNEKQTLKNNIDQSLGESQRNTHLSANIKNNYKQSVSSNVQLSRSSKVSMNKQNNVGYQSKSYQNENKKDYQQYQQQDNKLKYRPAQSYSQTEYDESMNRQSKRSNNLQKINQEEQFKNFTSNLGYN